MRRSKVVGNILDEDAFSLVVVLIAIWNSSS